MNVVSYNVCCDGILNERYMWYLDHSLTLSRPGPGLGPMFMCLLMCHSVTTPRLMIGLIHWLWWYTLGLLKYGVLFKINNIACGVAWMAGPGKGWWLSFLTYENKMCGYNSTWISFITMWSTAFHRILDQFLVLLAPVQSDRTNNDNNWPNWSEYLCYEPLKLV